MRRIGIAALAFCVSGCAPKPDPNIPAEPVVDRIQVNLSSDPSSAFAQAKSAFISEGLQLAAASADGGLIVSVPLTFRPGATFPSEYTYRATVSRTDLGSTVTLNASLHTLKQGDYSTTLPLTSVCKRYPGNECNEAWEKLEKLAGRLRQP